MAWETVIDDVHTLVAGLSTATPDFRGSVPVLDFDAGTDETAVFKCSLPYDYAAGGINVQIRWMASSATSGNVIWAAEIASVTPDADDLDSMTWASVQTAAASGAPSASGETQETTIQIADGSAMDSLAAGEEFYVRITRDADNASDTMAGDAELSGVLIREQP